MNKPLSFFLQSLFACVLVCVAACQAEQTHIAEEVPDSVSELERHIHGSVNAHRSTLGLAPFSYSEEVAEVARQHSSNSRSHLLRIKRDFAKQRFSTF